MKYQIPVTLQELLAIPFWLRKRADLVQRVRLLQNFNVVKSFPFKATSLIKTFPIAPVIRPTFPERRLLSLPFRGLRAYWEFNFWAPLLAIARAWLSFFFFMVCATRLQWSQHPRGPSVPPGTPALLCYWLCFKLLLKLIVLCGTKMVRS